MPRGAGRHLVKPVAGVLLAQAAEPGKGRKKLVMAGDALGRHKAAHGKAVNQRVAQVIVAFQRSFARNLARFAGAGARRSIKGER